MSDHLYKQFDTELENLKARVMEMGGVVEDQIIDAIEALTTGNLDLATRVIAKDTRINNFEMSLDEDCTALIARRQPAASDLRTVMTIIKIVADLERVGDEATKVARMTNLLYNNSNNLPRFNDVKYMGDLVLDMLRRSLDTFARMDTTTTTKIIRQDDQVDEEFRAIMRQLITFMMEDPRTISMALEVLFVAKALERIGDHAKNIAEHVVYLVKGRDVRHSSVEEIERADKEDNES